MAIGDDVYDVWMATGVRIEPWVFDHTIRKRLPVPARFM